MNLNQNPTKPVEKAIGKFLKEKNSTQLFFTIAGILILLFLVGIIIRPNGDQLNIFYDRLGDRYGDFFNVLQYISGRNPYFNELNGLSEKCYFPLSYLILYPFTLFDNYAETSLNQCWDSVSCMISLGIFTLISAIVYIHSLILLTKNYKHQTLFIVVLLLSSIFLFSIERGNLIILTAAFINYFFALYNSSNTRARYFALIALSLAATLKVYPAIFGLLLLREKRYKEILFCIIFTLIAVFLPFLFFENGLANIPQLWKNLQLNSDAYNIQRFFPRFGLVPLTHLALSRLGVSEGGVAFFVALSKGVVTIASISSIYLFFYEKRAWVRLALLSIILVQFPTNSALYTGLYLFPLLLAFLSKDEKSSDDRIFILLFILLINPFQITINHFSWTPILMNVSTLVLWAILFTQSASLRLKSIKLSANK